VSDAVKTVLSIVTISVVLVLLLKNPSSTSQVLNSFTGGFAQSVSVLQGNPYNGGNQLGGGMGNLTGFQPI
jgi:hypothetical protein